MTTFAFADDEVLEGEEVGRGDVGEFGDELAVEDGLHVDLAREVELAITLSDVGVCWKQGKEMRGSFKWEW